MITVKNAIQLPGAIWYVTPSHILCAVGWAWGILCEKQLVVVDPDTGDYYYSERPDARPPKVYSTFNLGGRVHSLDHYWDAAEGLRIVLHKRRDDHTWHQIASIVVYGCEIDRSERVYVISWRGDTVYASLAKYLFTLRINI